MLYFKLQGKTSQDSERFKKQNENRALANTGPLFKQNGIPYVLRRYYIHFVMKCKKNLFYKKKNHFKVQKRGALFNELTGHLYGQASYAPYCCVTLDHIDLKKKTRQLPVYAALHISHYFSKWMYLSATVPSVSLQGGSIIKR